MNYSKRMEPLIKEAKRIKADKSFTKEERTLLLSINHVLQEEARKFFEASESLEGKDKFLRKVVRGKMTMEEYNDKIKLARQTVQETRSFARRLKEIRELK